MKKKKIFDIIPPTERGVEISPIKLKREKHLKPLSSSKEKKKKEVKLKTISPGFDLKKKWWLGFLAIPLIIIVFAYFFIESRAEVEIWPKTKMENFKAEIRVDTSIKKINLADSILPGEIIEAESFISQEFVSSGKSTQEGMAQGTIQIYNAYSTSPQSLIAKTRFVSADGKLFRIPNRIVIPGAHYEKGNLVPGTIDATVEASETGEEYNIGPTTFSIPGFAGTALYTSFYGKSFSAMEGGFKREVSQITKEDLDNAQEILTERALEESRFSLEEKLTPDQVFLESLVTKEIVETSPLATAGQDLESFVFQVRGKSEVLTFKKSDLESFVKDYILTKIPTGNKLEEESLAIEYSLKEANLSKGEVVLELDIQAKTYSLPDKELLKKNILGKNYSIVSKEILAKYPEISKVQVRLSPFWIKNIPQNEERVEVDIVID